MCFFRSAVSGKTNVLIAKDKNSFGKKLDAANVIGNYAFRSANIDSIVFPKSIIRIENGALRIIHINQKFESRRLS